MTECTACESEPDALPPCPCAHAPCVHDRNAACRSKRGAFESEPYRCFWRLYSPGPVWDGTPESLVPAAGPLCRFCSAKVAEVLARSK